MAQTGSIIAQHLFFFSDIELSEGFFVLDVKRYELLFVWLLTLCDYFDHVDFFRY